LILTTPLERRRGGRGPGENRRERGILAERHRLDLVLSSQQAGIVHGMRRDTYVVVFQYLLLTLIPTVLPTPVHEFQFDLFSSHTHERERNFLYTIPCMSHPHCNQSTCTGAHQLQEQQKAASARQGNASALYIHITYKISSPLVLLFLPTALLLVPGCAAASDAKAHTGI